MKAGNIASQKLYYRDTQPKDIEPIATLLLMHGAGGSHLSWRRQFDLLTNNFRLIAVDLPGHGQSEGSVEVAIREYSDHIIEFMDMLQLKNVVLGGHSMGGAIALDVALRGSNKLGGLLLVAAGARLRVLPAIFSLIRDDFEVAIEGMINFMFGPAPSAELVDEEKQLLASISADVVLRDFAACDSFDVTNKVHSVALPTMIICGKEDRLTPPRYSEYLHEKIRDSKIALLDDCGHMPMLEQSAEFNRHVSSFLVGLK